MKRLVAIAMMFATSLSGCLGHAEELIGERDGLRVYERGKNDSGLCLATLLELAGSTEAGELPRLKLVLHPEDQMVKGMVKHADYRISGKEVEYFVGVSHRFMKQSFLLRSGGGSYTAFGIPESMLSPSNCSSGASSTAES